MPNVIRHKRSGTTSAVPSAGSLVAGELAINTADGKLFTKRDNGSVVEIGAASTPSAILVTSSNSASTLYPVLGSASSGASLFVDDVTTPFSYVPSTGTLTTKTYKASSVVGEVLTINGASLSSNAELTITTLAGVAGSEVYLGDGFVTINAPTTVTGDVDATGFSVAADAFTLTSGGIITKTAGFSLAATDNGKVITVNSATGVNVTVPTGLPVGFSATVIQLGAGQVTFVASSTTLNSYQGYLKTAGQHASASIVSYTTNVFNVAGALSA
jgi:hypothetical protein